MKNDFKKIAKAVKAARRVIVATHREPDGDAIGSLLAMGLYLKKIGKRPYIFSVSGLPAVFRFLPSTKLITKTLPKNKFDLVIGVDHSTRERLGLEDYFAKYPTKLLSFDHHPPGPQLNDFGIIDENYASTAELVFDYFKSVNFHPDKNIAKALMVGILTDTGFFKYANNSKPLEAVAELMRTGLTISKIENALDAHLKIEAVRLSGRLLERTKYNRVGDFHYSYVLMKDLKNVELDDIAGVSERIRNIKRGRFTLFLIEERGGIWRGRLRSRADQHFDVARLSRYFGGNGHRQAAGFRKRGKFDDIIKLMAKYSRK